MLHLLNGDSLTEQDKQAFKNNNTRAYLLNNNYELSQDNHIQSVDFKDERYNEEKGNFIGEAICKSIDVKLVNQDNDLDLENEDLEYRVGAKVGNTYKYISFGNFIVQKPENEEVNEQTSFQALDYMCKFNIPYEQRLTLPMTVGALVADVCSQAGVTLGTSTFRNSDKLIANNPFINGEQCREVIKSVAKISFSVAYINQENELCFGFNLKTTADEEITTDEYFELEPNKETKPISVIVLRSGEIPSNGRRIVDNALIAEYGENELIIEEDYLAYTDELRDEFLAAARSLMGLVYKPISIDLLGSIYLDFNDVLQITNLKDEVIKTYCLNNIHTYNGTLYNSISSPAVTESEEQYKYQDENKSKSKKTFANIDKANQRIDLVAEDVEEQASTISDLSVSVGEIQAEIESIADPVGEVTTTVSSITINDAVAGDLYELRIRGNNQVFGGLYPSDTLIPSNSLYPESPVSILRVNHRAKEEEQYEEDVYDLGVKYNGILRQIVIGGKEYFDEYVLSPEYNYNPKIIRRVKTDGSGILDNEVIEDVTEETGGIHVKLYSGEENIITLDKFLATIFVRYIRKTEFGEIYATNISVDNKIQVAKDEIDLEVNQKVDEDEIIAKINLAVEDQQGIIEVTGNQISIKSDTFELTPEGEITATAGNIAGFDFTDEKMEKEISGLYPFTTDDVILALKYINGTINLDSALLEIYDINEDDEVDVTDVVAMINIVKGTRENTKTVSGSVTINSEKIDEALEVALDSNVKTNIGLINTHSYSMRCKNFFVGEYVDNNYPYLFEGIEMHEDTKKIEISNGATKVVMGMDDYGRTIITSTVGTITCPDNNIEIVDVIARGDVLVHDTGYAMYGTNRNHYYQVDWGTTLQFYVDGNLVGSLSDKRLKDDILPINEDVLKAINEVEFKQFKLINRHGKISFGIIAQDLIEAFEKYKLDYKKYDIVLEVQYNLEDKTLYFIIDYEQFLVVKQQCLENKLKEQNDLINSLIKRIERLEEK